MSQGFYTLEEAANALGMAPDELNRMAQKRAVRAFADRGTWRFRTQDIQELGRKRGASPAPAAPADEGTLPAAHHMEAAAPPKPPAGDDEGVFGFALGADADDVPLAPDL